MRSWKLLGFSGGKKLYEAEGSHLTPDVRDYRGFSLNPNYRGHIQPVPDIEGSHTIPSWSRVFNTLKQTLFNTKLLKYESKIYIQCRTSLFRVLEMAKKVSYCQAKFRLYFAYIIILSRKFVLIFRLYYHFVKKNGAYISLIFAYTPLIFRLYPAYIRLYVAYISLILKLYSLMLRLYFAYIPLILSYCQEKPSLYFAYIIILSRKIRILYFAYIPLILAKELIFRLYWAYISLILSLFFAYTDIYLIFRLY